MRAKIMKSNRLLAAGLGLVLCFSLFLLTTKAIAEITSSRHNLLVPYTTNPIMTAVVGTLYNNYGEVCVYCHTPHGGQSSNAPLWNRTLPATGNYTPYSSTTMDTSVGQPDGISLACLSCHDGTIAVDSIANAPGSGYYTPGGSTNPGGYVGASSHYALAEGGCLICHKTGSVASNAPFEVAAFGQNLSNQHPISMAYPTGLTGATTPDPKFNAPSGSSSTARWFDEGNPGRADDNEVKLYLTGTEYKVQCATCHNPHGTTAASGTPPNQLGRNGVDYATFLRKSNSSSALCTTCHIK